MLGREATTLQSWPADARSMGTIEVRRATEHKSPHLSVNQYIWTPHPEFHDEFPTDYRLKMDCFTTQSGNRRFLPSVGYGDGSFLLYASVGGMAYLTRDWKRSTIDSDERLAQLKDYRFQQFLFQWSWNKKRRMDREIQSIHDIYLRSRERVDRATTSILPLWLARGQEETDPRRLDAEVVRTFLGEGIECQNEHENPKVSEAEFIRRRIVDIARTDPMQVNQGYKEATSRRLGMIRESFLSDVDIGREVREPEGRKVRSRLWAAYQRNDCRDTARFREWLFEDTDALVQSIARPKRSSINPTRQVVHREFADMVWESIMATSFLVRTQMQGFLADLPEPLSKADLTAFNALYEQHWWAGDLIPLVFYAHFPLLRPLLEELHETGCSNETRAAFANAVYLKTTMIKNRRDADCVRKSKPKNVRSVALRNDDQARSVPRRTREPGQSLPDVLGAEYFQTSIDELGIDGAAGALQSYLASLKSVPERLTTLATVRSAAAQDGTAVLIALVRHAATTPAIRTAALKELSQCDYSEPLGRLLEQVVLSSENPPKERIAAISALVTLYERHSGRREFADEIAVRIRAIGAPTGGTPRVRKQILAAVRTIVACESRLSANLHSGERLISKRRQTS
ncbi:MAG: hypothetical protein JWN70_1445 [Planctomycetaceae bacterium]|nr:hypothetical protein [Planctomycetaceae bacterium]